MTPSRQDLKEKRENQSVSQNYQQQFHTLYRSHYISLMVSSFHFLVSLFLVCLRTCMYVKYSRWCLASE